jgi:hypothetical protein
MVKTIGATFKRLTSVSTWGPRAFFWLNCLYLVVLAVILIGREASWLAIDRIPDPIGGVIPIGVPWFGALGAVTISSYGVFDHNSKWDTHWNYWHALRPIFGAVFAVVAFMIFVGLINATGTNPAVTPAATGTTGGIAYLVLAFVVGFREQTFRALVQRAVDILLGPGIPGETPTSVTVTVDKSDLGQVAKAAIPAVNFTVANTGSGVVAVNPSATTPPGLRITVTPNLTFKVVTDVAGQTIAPSSHISGQVQLVATATGDFSATFEVNGTFGSRSVVVRGSAT